MYVSMYVGSPHLSLVVSPPADDISNSVLLFHQRASVVVACRQRVKRPALRQFQGGEEIAHLARGNTAVERVSQSELSIVVLTPALQQQESPHESIKGGGGGKGKEGTGGRDRREKGGGEGGGGEGGGGA